MELPEDKWREVVLERRNELERAVAIFCREDDAVVMVEKQA